MNIIPVEKQNLSDCLKPFNTLPLIIFDTMLWIQSKGKPLSLPSSFLHYLPFFFLFGFLFLYSQFLWILTIYLYPIFSLPSHWHFGITLILESFILPSLFAQSYSSLILLVRGCSGGINISILNFYFFNWGPFFLFAYDMDEYTHILDVVFYLDLYLEWECYYVLCVMCYVCVCLGENVMK